MEVKAVVEAGISVEVMIIVETETIMDMETIGDSYSLETLINLSALIKVYVNMIGLRYKMIVAGKGGGTTVLCLLCGQ